MGIFETLENKTMCVCMCDGQTKINVFLFLQSKFNNIFKTHSCNSFYDFSVKHNQN